jgi:hypothetical protein
MFKAANQKSACVLGCVIVMESVPCRPIFEKCSHLRDKGGLLTSRTLMGFALTILKYNTKFSTVYLDTTEYWSRGYCE